MLKKISYQSLFIIGVLIFSSYAFSADSDQVCNTTTMEKSMIADGRFVDNNNGTITDNFTKLVWKKCSEGQNIDATCSGTAAKYTWEQALTHAKTIKDSSWNGYNDWRLPNIKELSSIVERACYGPSINKTFFPNTQADIYLTNSFSSNIVANVLVVNFVEGYYKSVEETKTYYVRLVRGGE